MRKWVATLLVLCTMLICSPSFATAPVDYGVDNCQPISWSYINHGGKQNYRLQFVAAINQVSAMTGIQFTESTTPDMVVSWTPSLAAYDEDALGITAGNQRDGYIVNSHIEFLNSMPKYYRHLVGKKVSYSFIYMLMIHELGHAVGLGHSALGDGVMSPVIGYPTLSQDDYTSFAAVRKKC